MAAEDPNRLRSNSNGTDLLNNLNIGFRRDKPRRPNRRRRPNRHRRPTTPMSESEHVHKRDDTSVSNTTESSVNASLAAYTTPTATVDEEMDGSNEDRGDDRDDDDDHDNTTDHDDFTCQPTSSQHSTYIRDNLEILQKKCSEFHACTQEVYNAENFHRILAGGNIQLSNFCGLMYANGGGRYTTLNERCSKSEREAIREDLGNRLATTLASPPEDGAEPSWEKLDKCLKRHARLREKRIDTACRLKKTTRFLCRNHDVDLVTEDFFNHEMEHLHCSCKAINAEAARADSASLSISLPVRMGIAGGVLGLLIILIVVVIVLCYRHRKVKRELDKHRMHYLPSPHGLPSAIYQEIGDHSEALDALRRARDQGNLPTNYHLLGQAPALPDRYVKDISSSRSDLAAPEENNAEYLEPIPDPTKGPKFEAHSNDAYNASQSSQRSGENAYDLSKNPTSTPPTTRAKQAENDTYFDRINLNRTGNNPEDDGGYSSLGRKYAGKVERGELGKVTAEETEPLNKGSEAGDREAASTEEPAYFILETQKGASEQDALTAGTSGSSMPV